MLHNSLENLIFTASPGSDAPEAPATPVKVSKPTLYLNDNNISVCGAGL